MAETRAEGRQGVRPHLTCICPLLERPLVETTPALRQIPGHGAGVQGAGNLWGVSQSEAGFPQRASVPCPWNSNGASTLHIFLVDSRKGGLHKSCEKEWSKFLHLPTLSCLH